MRMLGLTLLAATAAIAACAGPSDPGATDQAMAYRTGSRVKQPDAIQPDMAYYGADQLSHSPDQTITGAIAHAPATPVPPTPQ